MRFAGFPAYFVFFFPFSFSCVICYVLLCCLWLCKCPWWVGGKGSGGGRGVFGRGSRQAQCTESSSFHGILSPPGQKWHHQGVEIPDKGLRYTLSILCSAVLQRSPPALSARPASFLAFYIFEFYSLFSLSALLYSSQMLTRLFRFNLCLFFLPSYHPALQILPCILILETQDGHLCLSCVSTNAHRAVPSLCPQQLLSLLPSC